MIGRALWHYAQSMPAFNMPRRELESLQSKRMARALARAYDDVPYYHDLLKKVGRVPSDFRTPRDLRALPLLTKGELIESRGRLLSRRMGAKFSRVGSGTSGRAGYLAFDSPFRDVTIALQARHLTHFGVRPWKRLVSVWAPRGYWRKEPTGKNKGLAYTWADELGALATLARIATRFVPLQAAQNDPARDLRELVRLEPDFIMCPPSHLLRMAKHLPRDGGGVGANGIDFVNEVFTEAKAKRIERAFGAKAFNSLGSNELGVAGADCAFRRGMHLNEDWILFEVLREGEQVGPGEQGELVATVFSNETMPLIRYATGDTAELADGGVCQCGSSMVRVKKMLGRKDDWLRGSGGVLIPPLEVAEELESRLGMEEYQVVQTRLEGFTIKTGDPRKAAKELSGPLTRYLSGLVGVPVTLDFAPRPAEDIWLKNRPVIAAFQ